MLAARLATGAARADREQPILSRWRRCGIVEPTLGRYMADEQHSFLKEVYLIEYQKLKDEQIARIGFRDNLIYATLVAIGAILSFAITNPANYQALLILPLATFVLGWIYLSNDRKISDIGRYIRVV